MASHHGFIPCYIKQLPPRLHERAAQVAAEIHPRNAPAVPPPEGVFPPARLLVLNTKYWGPAPRTLTVSFLEDYSQAVKERILSHMNAWDCSVTFQLLPPGQVGDVRITLTGDGYWSYLGTDILQIPKDQPTMCLQDMDTQSEAELRRVVRHETGHTLGFPHEHLRREVVERIDPEKAYAYFGGYPNYWPREQTYSNVLTPLNPKTVTGTLSDEDSVMCYQLPGEIMYNGLPVKGGDDINTQDANFCHHLYPKGAPAAAARAAKGRGFGGAHVAEDWGPEQDVDMAQIMRHVLPAAAR